MVSAKREATEEDEAKSVKKAKLQDASSSSEPKPKPKQCVVLNPADCDLGILFLLLLPFKILIVQLGLFHFLWL